MIKKQPGDEIKITDENFTKVCAAVLQHIRESKLGAYKAWSHDQLATITIVVKEDKLAHLLRDQKLPCAGVDDEDMTAQDIESIKRALFQAWCHQYTGRASVARLHAAMDAAMSVLPAWQVDAIMDAATRATEAHRRRAYQRDLRRISLSAP